eukprot:357951-Chlamydomonas_euryale.AAC.2
MPRPPPSSEATSLRLGCVCLSIGHCTKPHWPMAHTQQIARLAHRGFGVYACIGRCPMTDWPMHTHQLATG